MRKLAILEFITLDGVMQAPKMPEEDRSGGFESGGWADPYWDQVMALVGKEAMAEPYDVLFGRNTYDMFAAHAGDTHPMNGFTKYVATSRPDSLSWMNSKAVTGDIPAQVAQLKEEDGPLLQVHGSCALVQALLAHDLVDELRLWTFPVVAGGGKRLFGGGAVPARFSLIKSDRTDNGVVMGLYKREAS
ncbi:MAG: dihydrofolate reductase family protein [Pseudomonadota bacterium]